MKFKTLFLLLTCSTVFNVSLAQDLVSVTYEGYVNSTPHLERYKNNPQKMAEMERAHEAASKIPSIHVMTFNKDEFSFLLQERIKNDQPTEKGGARVVFTACNDFYANIPEQYTLGEFDLGNKKYAIRDSLKTLDWKISNEKKEVMGYEVRKATAIYDSITKVEAWYAPKLAYKNGPSQYWGLPGLILEADEYNDYGNQNIVKVHYIAVLIEPHPKSAKIKRFEKLEQITQEEYDAKLEEMQKTWKEMHNDGVDKN